MITPPARFAAPLEAILAARIEAEGPITLADFMELALYHPQYGYYASPLARVGATGDFITSVSVGPLFGALIAHQIDEMWRACGKPKPWTLVEQGANDGRLMLDILSALQTHHPLLLAALSVVLVEPLPALRAKQCETLKTMPNIIWMSDLSELPLFHGVHLSNELPDAFPIRRFRWSGSWTEDRITLQEHRFTFINQPLDESARALLENAVPPSLHRIVEIAPSLEPWSQLLLERLQSGYLFAFDYGLLEPEWNQPHRSNGSLRSYRNHQHMPDPLADPGEQDITSHVDLSRWSTLLIRHGANHVQITDQHRFCTGVASLHFPDQIRAMTPSEQRELLQFRSLSHPSLFGGVFRVLAAAKSAPPPTTLSGFKFSL
ncbi:MAG: hypothetical protein RIS92_2321 [Verrucomicrobiota bacterium]|jgi:SAM-dependent MidA family methyltransferase